MPEKYIAVSKLKELWEKSSIADWEYCTKTWLDISKAIESGELETLVKKGLINNGK